MSRSLLTSEQALVRRWLREHWLPLEAWRWLAGHPVEPPAIGDRAEPCGLPMLIGFVEPLATDAHQHQRQALSDNLWHVSSLMTVVAERGRGNGRACHERMLAATLLPLYRGLACGQLEEITRVMRLHLAETLTLVALTQELGEAFEQLLHLGLTREQLPHDLTRNHLDIDLGRLSKLLMTCAVHQLGDCSADQHAIMELPINCDQRPAWGEPLILWRLAGQLLSDRADFVIPRDWIDIPVPWQQVSDHWRALQEELYRPLASNVRRSPTDQYSAASLDSQCHAIASAPLEPSPPASSPATDTSTTQANTGTVDLGGEQAPTAITPQGSTATSDAPGLPTSLALELDIASSVASLVHTAQSSRPCDDDNHTALPADRATALEPPIHQLAIAEVHSHNDPIFVAEVRRHLAICRSEDRTVSLLAIRVQPEESASNATWQSSAPVGCATWQQQLINWLFVHPEVHQPQAFASREGELILCLLDIERNTATAILRQGIEESLSSLVSRESSTASSCVATPVQYHSGIASVSSPVAGLSPEQFIAAVYRCMAAAQRHGKACIKSIEVF